MVTSRAKYSRWWIAAACLFWATPSVWAGNVSPTIQDTGESGGIGTMNPTSMLHVAGDVKADGNIAAKYQDVAEWVRTPRPLSPGTVVVIDPAGANQVVEGNKPFDTLVAGVVSARPGVVLGEKSDDTVAVAHSGRVKVKVDARYGAVAVGDLLVTSPTTGHAMRATADGGNTVKPGTLLGK